jgi:hypothetical protein
VTPLAIFPETPWPMVTNSYLRARDHGNPLEVQGTDEHHRAQLVAWAEADGCDLTVIAAPGVGWCHVTVSKRGEGS